MYSVGVSPYDINAELDIVKLLSQERVAYKNEIKYRLEKRYFHTVTDYAVNRLENGKAYNQSLKIERYPKT